MAKKESEDWVLEGDGDKQFESIEVVEEAPKEEPKEEPKSGGPVYKRLDSGRLIVE